jgi:SARP family transcriptional regulator, regulator of embCAB operon
VSAEPLLEPARPPAPVTVVVAHRRDADRQSLVRWLSADARFSPVAGTDDGAAAVAAVAVANPDVALIDIELAGSPGGLALIAALRDTHPSTAVVAVADADDDRAYGALGAGAVGCYLWSDPASPLTTVVAGAARGEGLLTPGWAGRLVDEVGWLSREPGPLPAPELSPTELEVVRRVASGASPAAIAALHGVTEHVVNVHAGIVITKVFRHHDDARRLGLTPT